MSHVSPRPPYLVIRPVDSAADSPIITPDESRETPQTGIIIKVWDDALMHDAAPQLLFEEGDSVIFGRHAGIEIPDSDDILVHQDDVFAVVTAE